jgi:predicted RNA binding protein YcfA (HicA-like mRNA interferase family)
MLKLPSISSNKMVKLLNKGGAVLVRQGKTNHMQYIQEWWRERGILLQFRWEKRHWIQFTVNEFSGS